MRSVMIGDLIALARGLTPLPAEEQASACQTAFSCAHIADKFRKRLGRLHPHWGNGSVMAFALLTYRVDHRADLSDPDFCDTLQRVLIGLREWRLSQSRRRNIWEPPD